MRYVQRNGQGKVIADYARAQPGLAEEEIDESHPDYVEWITPPPPDPRVQAFTADASRIDLLQRLKTATPAQVRTWVGNNVTSLAEARTLLANILVLIALDHRK